MASYRSSTTQANSGATLTVTKPSGVVDGDYILVGIHVNDVPNDIASVPSGWATIVSKLDYGSEHLTIFGKSASGEGASWDWTMNNANSSHGIAIAIKEASIASPVDASGGQTNGSSTNLTAPSISPATSDALLVAFFAHHSSGDITMPGSMTEREDATVNTRRMGCATEALSSSGATGTRVATIASANINAGALVAVANAVAGGSMLLAFP